MAKGMYIGITKTLPIYSTTTNNLAVTASNISQVFTVANSSYYFAGSGSTFTTTNGGVHSSTAQTTLTALYDMSISFNYSYSSESGWDKFTLTVAGTTVESAVSGSTTTKSYSGTISKGKTIVFQYTKDSSGNTYDDKCTFYNMQVSYSVQTQTGSETKSVACKVKKAYIGIDGKARKVKKIYIGVDGKARLVWSGSGGSVEKHSASLSLSEAACKMGSTSIGNYALFAGGYTNRIYSVNKSLTMSSMTNLDNTNLVVGSHVPSYALFASNSTNVYAYSSSLTKTGITQFAQSMGGGHSGTHVGDIALFGGGTGGSGRNIYYYTASLARGTATFSAFFEYGAATTVGNYALFGGNNDGATTSTVNAFNSSLTLSTPTGLSVERFELDATHIGDKYAIFAGGKLYNSSGSISQTVVDIYNTSLTRTIGTPLSTSRYGGQSATHNDTCAVIAGGGNTDSYGAVLNSLEIYDSSLTRTNQSTLSEARSYISGGHIGNYMIFAGGYTTSGYRTTIDVYTAD